MTKRRLNLRNVVAGAICLAGLVMFSGCDKNNGDDNGNGNAEGTPQAVMNFTATAGDGQVSLSWNAPSDNGGSEITGYEVTRDNWANKVTKTASELTHTYTGLTNGTIYTFKVRAINVKGAGAESTAQAMPTAGGGGNLDHTVGDRYIKIIGLDSKYNGGRLEVYVYNSMTDIFTGPEGGPQYWRARAVDWNIEDGVGYAGLISNNTFTAPIPWNGSGEYCVQIQMYKTGIDETWFYTNGSPLVNALNTPKYNFPEGNVEVVIEFSKFADGAGQH
jgi:hypothetical protein